MAQNAVSGALAYINYGFETTYGTAVVAGRTFGHGIKGTMNAKNNMERVYGLGNRNATTTVSKKFECSASLEFYLSHGTFLRAVLGSVADAGGGPYTHTYSEADSIPSMTIIGGAELGTGDLIYSMAGCKVNTCSISSSVGEAIRVKLDVLGSSVSVTTSSVGSQVAATEDIFTFAHGTLEIPTSTTIADVQTFDITTNNTLENLWGLGARTATAGVEKQREYNIKMTVALKDVTALMTSFLGDASSPYTPAAGNVAAVATLKLTFTNGLVSTAERSIVWTMADVYLDEDSFNLDPNEIIKEDITGWCLSSTSAIWTNNTADDDSSP